MPNPSVSSAIDAVLGGVERVAEETLEGGPAGLGCGDTGTGDIVPGAAIGGGGPVGTLDAKGSSLGRNVELISPMPTKKSSVSQRVGGSVCVRLYQFRSSWKVRSLLMTNMRAKRGSTYMV